MLFELGEIWEKSAFADKHLVFKTGDLGHFIDKVNDGKGNFNDRNVEVVEHAFELYNAQVEEIHWLRFKLIILFRQDLLMDVIFYLVFALA